MRVETLAGHIFNLYSSIKEMPEWKWQKLRLVMLQLEGIGCTEIDIIKHEQKIELFKRFGKEAEAQDESRNLHLNKFAIDKGIDFVIMSFCCLLDDIDGNKTDISTDES